MAYLLINSKKLKGFPHNGVHPIVCKTKEDLKQLSEDILKQFLSVEDIGTELAQELTWFFMPAGKVKVYVPHTHVFDLIDNMRTGDYLEMYYYPDGEELIFDTDEFEKEAHEFFATHVNKNNIAERVEKIFPSVIMLQVLIFQSD